MYHLYYDWGQYKQMYRSRWISPRDIDRRDRLMKNIQFAIRLPYAVTDEQAKFISEIMPYIEVLGIEDEIAALEKERDQWRTAYDALRNDSERLNENGRKLARVIGINGRGIDDVLVNIISESDILYGYIETLKAASTWMLNCIHGVGKNGGEPEGGEYEAAAQALQEALEHTP